MPIDTGVSALAQRLRDQFNSLKTEFSTKKAIVTMASKAPGTPPALRIEQPDDTTDTGSAEMVQVYHGASKTSWVNEWGAWRTRIPSTKSGEAAFKAFLSNTYTGIAWGISQDGAPSTYNVAFHGDGSMLLTKQTSTPATAQSATIRVYVKSDNVLYRKNDSNVEMPVDASWENCPFTQPGALTVKVGTGRYPVKGGTFQIQTVAVMVGTAPTGASVLVDVNKNGSTIYGTQANRPTIAAGSTAATVGAHTATTVTDGDWLTIDIDQIGSSVAGSDLTVVIRMQRIA